MGGLLDTSMIVRYLVGDPPHLARDAAAIIDSSEALEVTDAVLAETAYVLTSVYGIARADVVDHLIAFLGRVNVNTFAIDTSLVRQALLLCRPSGRISFVDALTWAAARSTREGVVFTLDDRFPSADVQLRRHLDRS